MILSTFELLGTSKFSHDQTTGTNSRLPKSQPGATLRHWINRRSSLQERWEYQRKVQRVKTPWSLLFVLSQWKFHSTITCLYNVHFCLCHSTEGTITLNTKSNATLCHLSTNNCYYHCMHNYATIIQRTTALIIALHILCNYHSTYNTSTAIIIHNCNYHYKPDTIIINLVQSLQLRLSL